MNYYLSAMLGFSVAISAIIGWIRFNKTGPAFLPFLILVTVATANEIVSFAVIHNGHSNAVNTNIYSLLEGILITWQFERWKLFRHRKFAFVIVAIIIISWCVEVFFLSSIRAFTSYFIVISSFLTVLMSIGMVNKLLLEENAGLLKNAIFLICLCFIVLYLYNAIIEIFWIYGLDASATFRLYIYRIFYYINLLTNLTYALAVLWIPKKREFILLS